MVSRPEFDTKVDLIIYLRTTPQVIIILIMMIMLMMMMMMMRMMLMLLMMHRIQEKPQALACFFSTCQKFSAANGRQFSGKMGGNYNEREENTMIIGRKYNEIGEIPTEWGRWKSFVKSREHLTFLHLSLKRV